MNYCVLFRTRDHCRHYILQDGVSADNVFDALAVLRDVVPDADYDPFVSVMVFECPDGLDVDDVYRWVHPFIDNELDRGV